MGVDLEAPASGCVEVFRGVDAYYDGQRQIFRICVGRHRSDPQTRPLAALDLVEKPAYKMLVVYPDQESGAA